MTAFLLSLNFLGYVGVFVGGWVACRFKDKIVAWASAEEASAVNAVKAKL